MGRNVVITGASSGIGLATAKKLAAAGHRVMLGARRYDLCDDIARELRAAGLDAFASALDLSDEDSIARFADAAADQLGGVDALICNAGQSSVIPAMSVEQSRFRDIIDVNLFGAQALTARLAPALVEKQSGDLIFLSSEAVSSAPRSFMSPYTASKAALEAWVAVLQTELEGSGVRASVVRPGPTDSEHANSWDATELTAAIAAWKRTGVVRHWELLKPEDVAEVLLTLVQLRPGVHMRLVEVCPLPPIRKHEG